jgi:hypothetical protein
MLTRYCEDIFYIVHLQAEMLRFFMAHGVVD